MTRQRSQLLLILSANKNESLKIRWLGLGWYTPWIFNWENISIPIHIEGYLGCFLWNILRDRKVLSNFWDQNPTMTIETGQSWDDKVVHENDNLVVRTELKLQWKLGLQKGQCSVQNDARKWKSFQVPCQA